MQDEKLTITSYGMFVIKWQPLWSWEKGLLEADSKSPLDKTC
jgi:hypothetical protein